MNRALFVSTALVGAISLQSPAWGQSTATAGDASTQSAETSTQSAEVATQSAEGSETGDIIVTANRREELLQRVGVSVTAVTGETLENRNIRTSEDLGRLVPGLNATAATGSGVSIFVIRGVGQTDFSDHQEQPNATYQDGVYVPFSTAAGIPLFDLQRAEALRGPQGTLFGRNATGGLIQYVSNKPVEGTSGSIEAAYGMRDLSRIQGFINAGSDLISGRLAFFYQSQDGFLVNTLGRDRGDKDVYALRGQVRIQPAAETTILLRADGFNQSGTSSGYKAMPEIIDFANGNRDLPPDVDAYGTGPGKDPYGYRNPFKGLKVALDDPGKLRKRSRNYAMTIDQGLGGATLTSTTAYSTIFNNYREDTDSSPLNTFTAESLSEGHNFQQELRISGSSDRLRYTAGLFFLEIDGDYSLNNEILIPPAIAALFGVTAGRVFERNEYSMKTQSEAVYGQFEYDLTDRLTAIIGARYTWDQLKFRLYTECRQDVIGACAFFGGSGGTTTVVPGVGPLRLKDKEDDWSGKVQLNFKPTEDVLLYASAGKGVKSSGFSAILSNVLPVESLNYKPENLYAYEIGHKGQFFDRRLTVNASAYYYDYKDFQTFLFATTTTQVLNREAEAYGGELEIAARPMRGLSANVSVAYNHFDVKELFPGFADQRPINAPRLQLTWGLTKSFDLSEGLDLTFDYAGRYISSTFYNIVNAPLVRAPSYSISDFTVRLESDRGWYAAAYLNNAFDKRYQVGAFDVFLGYALRQYGEPRTFSGAVGFRF